MSVQKTPITVGCARPRCERDGTHGVYAWNDGETTVNLNKPRAVVCGQHKPRPGALKNRYLRVIKVRRT